MGCSCNFQFCCRQDTIVFKIVQLRAGSNAINLQTQFLFNRFKTSALAGRERGISPTFCLPLIYPECVKPVFFFSSLSGIKQNRYLLSIYVILCFPTWTAKVSLADGCCAANAESLNPLKLTLTYRHQVHKQHTVKLSSSEAPPLKQCWTPRQATILDSGA